MTTDLTDEERELLVKVLDGLQYNGLEAARKFMAIQEKLQSHVEGSDNGTSQVR